MNDNSLIKQEKLKRAQSLVGTSKGRPEHDFYATPEYATKALLEKEQFEGNIWEPACGQGHISNVLISHGYDVLSTDLIDRGYGETNHDFFTSSYFADNIITNPPYSLGENFVRHSLLKTSKKCCMLLKLAFLEGKARRNMFETTPLVRVHVFSNRLKMVRNGDEDAYKNGGMIAFAWFVWEHGYNGLPTIDWM